MSVLPVCRGSSRDDAANLEVEDRVHVEAELAEDGVAVLVELRRPPRCGRLAAVLDRRGGQLERRALGRAALLDVAVGHGLLVRRSLERVLDHGPLPGELGEPLAPLVRGAAGDRLPYGVAG